MGGPAATIGWAIGKPGGGREKSETVGGIVMSGVIMGTWLGAVGVTKDGCGEPESGGMRDMREGSLVGPVGVLFGI